MFRTNNTNKENNIILNFSLIIILVYWLFYVLYIWQALIIPFVIALLLAFSVLWLANFYQKIKIPSFLSMILAIWTYFLVFYFIWSIISSNINELIKLAPSYEEKIISLMKQTFDYFWIQKHQVSEFMSNIKLQDIFNYIYSVVLSISSSIWTILFYMIFILLEAKYFSKKIELMISNPEKRENVLEVLEKIETDMKWYFFIKVIVSILTAILSYFIMIIFGLNFSIFWALLIFILNFIPNIGSIIAVFFPALLSLIQPEFSIYFSFFMTLLLIIVQIIVWNVIEPKMMWNRLNLSPLVIIIALSFWWYVWWIIGMLLSVPLMVIINIILSKFEITKPIAIFLSEKWEPQVFDSEKIEENKKNMMGEFRKKFIK